MRNSARVKVISREEREKEKLREKEEKERLKREKEEREEKEREEKEKEKQREKEEKERIKREKEEKAKRDKEEKEREEREKKEKAKREKEEKERAKKEKEEREREEKEKAKKREKDKKDGHKREEPASPPPELANPDASPERKDAIGPALGLRSLSDDDLNGTLRLYQKLGGGVRKSLPQWTIDTISVQDKGEDKEDDDKVKEMMCEIQHMIVVTGAAMFRPVCSEGIYIHTHPQLLADSRNKSVFFRSAM